MKINGHRIDSEVILRDGDIIEIGETQIMFADQEFDDRESAMYRYKQQGQRGKSTLVKTRDEE